MWLPDLIGRDSWGDRQHLTRLRTPRGVGGYFQMFTGKRLSDTRRDLRFFDEDVCNAFHESLGGLEDFGVF